MGLRGGTPGSKWQAEQQELTDRRESESIRRALDPNPKVWPEQLSDRMTPTPEPQPPTPPQPGPEQVDGELLLNALTNVQHWERERQWCDSGELSRVEEELESAVRNLCELLSPAGRAEGAALPVLLSLAQADAEAELRARVEVLEAAAHKLFGVHDEFAQFDAQDELASVDATGETPYSYDNDRVEAGERLDMAERELRDALESK